MILYDTLKPSGLDAGAVKVTKFRWFSARRVCTPAVKEFSLRREDRQIQTKCRLTFQDSTTRPNAMKRIVIAVSAMMASSWACQRPNTDICYPLAQLSMSQNQSARCMQRFASVCFFLNQNGSFGTTMTTKVLLWGSRSSTTLDVSNGPEVSRDGMAANQIDHEQQWSSCA
jgi:hypothetical protein